METIVKYMSAGGLNKFLKYPNMSFCRIDKLNDPYECTLNLRPLMLELEKEIDRKILSKNQENLLDLLIQKKLNQQYDALTIIKQMYYVMSLSTRANNLLMWSHYADQHRGVAIEYNKDHPFFKGDGKSVRAIRAVDYREKRNCSTVIGKSDLNELPVIVENICDLLHIKPSCWSYEQEYRQTCIRTLEGDVSLDRIMDGTKDDENYLRFPIGFDSIKCIYLGVRFNEENDENCESINLMRSNNILFKKSTLDDEMFRINFI